ncbi:MAG: GGDEF domain-containing protein [Myxococcaceae bacterium]|nr:GGDEF domain-containing protein [Myxococcaceae bacterium]
MAGGPEVSKGGYKRILGVLFHLTRLVNEGVPFPELLQAVARSASDLTGADSCSIMLLDDTKQELLSKASSGLTPEEEERITFRVGEGVAGWVAANNASARIEDVSVDPRFKAVRGQALKIGAILSVPLQTREGVIGVITVTSSRTGAFGTDHLELMEYLGGAIVKDIENARLYRLSITDSLTRAFNRQYLYQRLPDELDRCRRFGDPLSVVLFDVDHFKQFNDTWGHAAGDFVLKELARRVNLTVREIDGLVRYGGEEFLLLLPKTGREGAAELAERVRRAVESASFRWGEQSLQVTVSLGVAALGGAQDSDEQLLRRADEALYAAKQAGRNRVVIAPAA